jgi:hypothetical protein
MSIFCSRFFRWYSNDEKIPLLLGIAIIAITILLCTDFFLIDDCMDHGGVWDDKELTCLFV